MEESEAEPLAFIESVTAGEAFSQARERVERAGVFALLHQGP